MPNHKSGRLSKTGYIKAYNADMIKYKKDILKELRRSGYSGYALNRDKLIPYATQTRIRSGHIIGADTLDRVCAVLRCQPGDLIEWVDDTEQAESPEQAEH